MESKLNIEITESGKKRLEEVTQKFKKEILDKIQASKYAPGDEFIEVTASDVDRMATRLKFIQPQKSQLKQLVLATYSFLGVILIFASFFFDDFIKIINDNPQRLTLLVTGTVLTLVSIILSGYLKQKQKLERDYIEVELEKNKISEIYSIIQDSKQNDNAASTQYNDLRGTAAIDFHGNQLELADIFIKHNIDINRYEPFGMSIYYSNLSFSVSLLAIDKILDVRRKGSVKMKTPLISISTNISKEEFDLIYKRFHIILTKNDNFEIFNEI